LHTLSGGWGEQHFPLCCGHGKLFYLTLLLLIYAFFISGVHKACWIVC
jgi:hypothetical protein